MASQTNDKQAQSVPVKMDYDGDLRRFRAAQKRGMMGELCAEARRLFGLSADQAIKFSYRDDEGDTILVASDSELTEAVNNMKGATLHLSLVLAGGPLADDGEPSAGDGEPSEAAQDAPPDDLVLALNDRGIKSRQRIASVYKQCNGDVAKVNEFFDAVLAKRKVAKAPRETLQAPAALVDKLAALGIKNADNVHRVYNKFGGDEEKVAAHFEDVIAKRKAKQEQAPAEQEKARVLHNVRTGGTLGRARPAMWAAAMKQQQQQAAKQQESAAEQAEEEKKNVDDKEDHADEAEEELEALEQDGDGEEEEEDGGVPRGPHAAFHHGRFGFRFGGFGHAFGGAGGPACGPMPPFGGHGFGGPGFGGPDFGGPGFHHGRRVGAFGPHVHGQPWRHHGHGGGHWRRQDKPAADADAPADVPADLLSFLQALGVHNEKRIERVWARCGCDADKTAEFFLERGQWRGKGGKADAKANDDDEALAAFLAEARELGCRREWPVRRLYRACDGDMERAREMLRKHVELRDRLTALHKERMEVRREWMQLFKDVNGKGAHPHPHPHHHHHHHRRHAFNC